MKIIKTYNLYNESLKDKIKGPSNDDILRNIKDMIPEHKFTSACEHHMTWLVEKLIKDGHDPSFGDNMCLINCGILKYEDIVNILMKNDKVIKQLYLTQLEYTKNSISDDDDGGYYDDDDNWIEDEEGYTSSVNWQYGEEEEYDYDD